MKAVLLDVDGLLILPRAMYFSQKYALEKGKEFPTLITFFKTQFMECVFGRADLKEEIAPYLAEWEWKGTVDEFLEAWFVSESTTDAGVLAAVGELRALGIRCYIATRQEKYRYAYLLNDVGLRAHVDGAFCTSEIGYDKSDPRYFTHILEQLDLPAGDVAFFDDRQENVEAARSLGMHAYLFENAEQLKRLSS